MDTNQNLTSQIFTEAPLVYGTFWERLGAVIIDSLILSIPNYFINTYFTFAAPIHSGTFQFNLLSTAVMWLYFALQESGPNQATIGKRALGLKVINSNGGRITFGQATGRHFGKWVSFVILFIGFLMVLWDDKRQALHDKMAGTYIVKR
jgi:uncharacterized RDD family membrane protein YckC